MTKEPTQNQPQSITNLEPKMRLEGVVKEVQLYGAIVDIGLEYDGLVHISQIAPKRINRVSDVVHAGDQVTVWVTKVNPENGRIGLTMVEPPDVEWGELQEGQNYTGTVTRLERYGAFVDIGAERAGLLHVREMSSGYVRDPSELLQIGDEVDVRVLKIDRRRRRIDLTKVDVMEIMEDELENQPPTKTTMEFALERARAEARQEEKHRRRGKPVSPDLSERESILASTLERHAKQQ
jgi:small subunit ribosomal protein S1